jgi:hypothetical protein
LYGATNGDKLVQNDFPSNSVLASGKWIKVSASARGMVKLTYDQLKQMGIASPENVSVYTQGGYMLSKMNAADYPMDLKQIPVCHYKDANGKDAIFFYSTGTTRWKYDQTNKVFVHELNLYSDKVYFYLTSDGTKSPSPNQTDKISEIATFSTNTSNDYLMYENELINLAKSGRLWFSDRIMQSMSKDYSFSLPNIVQNVPTTITIAAAAQSRNSTKHKVTISNTLLGEIGYGISYEDMKGVYKEANFSVNTGKDLKMNIYFDSNSSSADSWVDFIRMNYQSSLSFNEQQISFRNTETYFNTVAEFKIKSTDKTPVILNVTNPLQPKTVSYSVSGDDVVFKDYGGEINEYIMFSPTKGNFEEPIFVEQIANQNIQALPVYEMIIVSHPNFLTSAEKLAEFHRKNDGLSVLVVTPKEIYNEFSSGMPDPAGIRNMIRHFYKKSTSTDSLRYVLLMGDGHYNNRNYNGSYPNYIPTWQSTESLNANSTFQSDDFYVLLDEKEGEFYGKIDVGIGRIPCATAEEAEGVVNKVINYASPSSMGNWRNVVTFIADDEDDNTYPDQSESLIETIDQNKPGFFAEKIYFDSYQQISTSSGKGYPDVTDAINRRVGKGSLILNYIGHASETAMAHESVLGINDIKSWNNINALPIFVTATCEISRFDEDITTAGENILLNPVGGGIALFTTTRVVYSGSNFQLSSNFYNNVFKQDNQGENLRMGDIMRLAKNSPSDLVNLRKFALLGDPALQLAFPQYKVKTSEINGITISEQDTIVLGALGKVTVKGFITDQTGTKNTSLNGSLSSTIYDKTVKVKTLANDGGDKFEYPIQNNIIYKGLSTVTNGEFEFTFIVPKDILYNIGNGKILYYFFNDSVDGNGASANFKIGGTSPNPIIDNNAPEIEPFMNSRKFKDNDKVASSALLLVDLTDESGINTVGTGIGHDIIAVIDNDYANQMVLNDYYASASDSYQKGTITFPLNNLTPGQHTLLVKAWDVQNNSAVKEITFFVEDGFKVISLSNYPNPVKFYTNFVVEHNLPGNYYDAKVEIFNLMGYKVHEFTEPISSIESTESSIRWEVSSLRRTNNERQILIYRVTLTNQDGVQASRTGKLILSENN